MSALPMLNHPSSVLTYLAPEGGIYGGEEFAERKRRMRALASPLARIMCHHNDVNMLEIFQELLIECGPGLIKHARVRERMGKNPLLAVQMLLSSYNETQPMLERTVLSSGEAAVPLILAIDDGRIEPRANRETYERPLLDQPWWGMRYLSVPTANPKVAGLRTAFAKALTKVCAERQKFSPQAALVHLFFNAELDPQPYAATLCQEPMVAYLASRLLCARGLDLHLDQVQNLDARWATHIALWGGFSGGNVDARVEEAIITHAAWTGEYIARNEPKHKDWGWVRGLYERMEAGFKARSNDPDLWADLLWAMLDRICLKVEGKNPNITLRESLDRHNGAAAAPAVVAAAVAESDGDSAFAGTQN